MALNKRQKVRLVREVVKDVVDKIVKQIKDGKIPEDWNGYELRWLLAEKFEDQTRRKGFERLIKEYRNTVLVNNL